MSSTAISSPNAANVLEPIAEDMQQVNRVIRQRLASEVMLINQISEYIIGAGGKRLRPALLLLVAGALGDTTGHRHELAAVGPDAGNGEIVAGVAHGATGKAGPNRQNHQHADPRH